MGELDGWLFFSFFFFPSPYLFIHSFQYTKHFMTAMETFAAAKLANSYDQCQAHTGKAHGSVQLCGMHVWLSLFLISSPK